MDDQRLKKKNPKKDYKEQIRKTGLAMQGILSGRMDAAKKNFTEKNRTLDFVVTTSSKKDPKKSPKNYLAFSKQPKGKIINNSQNHKDISIPKKSLSKKIAEAHSLINSEKTGQKNQQKIC
jgi:hypothetical protein